MDYIDITYLIKHIAKEQAKCDLLYQTSRVIHDCVKFSVPSFIYRCRSVAAEIQV